MLYLAPASSKVTLLISREKRQPLALTLNGKRINLVWYLGIQLDNAMTGELHTNQVAIRTFTEIP